MANRFYATVFAADERQLRDLQDYELDLFRSTAVASRVAGRRSAEQVTARASSRPARDRLASERPDDLRIIELADQPSIDGYLTLEDAARLVADGYRVLLERDVDAAGRAHVIGIDRWLKEMGEAI